MRVKKINGLLMRSLSTPTSNSVKLSFTENTQAQINNNTNHVKIDELLSMFNSAYTTSYSELTYVDGNITKIEVYTGATKLFTKTITYTDGKITEITITNNVIEFTLTKTINYDSSGKIINVRIV